MTEPLLIERDEGVVTLSLNRPEIRNAMDPALTEAFAAAVEALRGDRTTRAVIITGTPPAFCAGGDLSWIEPGPDADVPMLREKMRAFYGRFLGIRTVDVPVIAAINGAAVGAGLCLAMACDIRLAAESAKLSAPFAKLGMHPGMAATYLLTRLVGTARASDLLFTGRTLDGVAAERIGLVNEVVPDGELLDRARAIARQIASNAPIPMAMTKRAIYLAERADMETMIEYEALAQPITMATSDLLEGLAAVREKRAPRFEGR